MCASCNDFLDREPLSNISPEMYYNREDQLAAFAVNYYTVILPCTRENLSTPLHGGVESYQMYTRDNSSDNQISFQGTDVNWYSPDNWKTGSGGGTTFGGCTYDLIYGMNFFLDRVIPKWKAGEIEGDPENIKHYIGEVYFHRASIYFGGYLRTGDLPIVRHVIPDDYGALLAESKRQPRNEVARFIISDLDSAAMLMKKVSPDGRKLRLSSYVAQLLKSRVALVEGTWLKHFKDTPFVPNGPGWPGKNKDYNASYQFPTGSVEAESNWFLEQAMLAAQIVADDCPLTENNGIFQQEQTDPANPYFDMYCNATDLSGYSEILLWREYVSGVAEHTDAANAQRGNDGNGLTRSLVESFLMANGLPIYAEGSGYAGDDYIADVRKNRDGRLWMWLKVPGQKNIVFPEVNMPSATPVELVPDVASSSGWGSSFPTGYVSRKGGSIYGNQYVATAYTGLFCFRSAEAFLNYLEACYEKNGSLDSKAQEYWRALRTRARVDPDFNKTIAATDMSKETLDWGAYSGGKLVDATLYNIRRERRGELFQEGLRDMDLHRWRAYDQLIDNPYHFEGFKLWGPMKEWYDDENFYGTDLKYGYDIPDANVSPPEASPYIRPFQVKTNHRFYGGVTWRMAHYLTPISIGHFIQTARESGGNINESPVYQNPYWSTEAGMPAEQ
jgi:hypothetical protein